MPPLMSLYYSFGSVLRATERGFNAYVVCRSREDHSTDRMDIEVMMKTLTDAYDKMQQARGSVYTLSLIHI